MKQLSKRAEKYLSGLNRDMKWCCDRDKAIEYMEMNNIPVSKSIVRYQVNYSGYDLTIHGDEAETFYMRLFSREAISKGNAIEAFDCDGGIMIDCGYHETAQYNFFINENGEIIAESGNDSFVLHSSADAMIESYAFLNSIPDDFHKSIHYCEVVDKDYLFADLSRRNFRLDKDSEDNYHSYFTKGKVIVCCSVFWTNEGKYVLSFYGKDEESCKQLLEQLIRTGLCR